MLNLHSTNYTIFWNNVNNSFENRLCKTQDFKTEHAKPNYTR